MESQSAQVALVEDLRIWIQRVWESIQKAHGSGRVTESQLQSLGLVMHDILNKGHPGFSECSPDPTIKRQGLQAELHKKSVRKG